jgi:ketosteroid isomerase-like protein
MTNAQPADTSSGYHAFTAAVAARDLDALVASLAPDAVAHSAVMSTPFEGRDVLADLYASLFESFEELRVTDEFQNGDTHAFFWEGRIDGRFVAGADRVRIGPDGKVREITIVGRPLSGLMTFVTGIGFRFARRRRGPIVARILRLTALPLAPLFSLFEPLTRWLVRGGRARKA